MSIIPGICLQCCLKPWSKELLSDFKIFQIYRAGKKEIEKFASCSLYRPADCLCLSLVTNSGLCWEHIITAVRKWGHTYAYNIQAWLNWSLLLLNKTSKVTDSISKRSKKNFHTSNVSFINNDEVSATNNKQLKLFAQLIWAFRVTSSGSCL